jgi:hypothetical protein
MALREQGVEPGHERHYLGGGRTIFPAWRDVETIASLHSGTLS